MIIEAIASIYKPRFVRLIIYKKQQFNNRPFLLLSWFWNTSNFNKVEIPSVTLSDFFLGLVGGGMILQYLVAAAWGLHGYTHHQAGVYQFAVAVFIATPVVWVHTLVFMGILRKPISLRTYKTLSKNLLCRVLERQVKVLRKKYNFDIVAVAGSVGKTSTKRSIAQILSEYKTVQFQSGNYNDRLTVPLVIFGQTLPKLHNLFAWVSIIAKNNKVINSTYPYDVVILELGTDGPGQIKKFKYLKPDISVVTSIEPEHMEFFANLDDVAKEEMAVVKFSKEILINIDDVENKYLPTQEYLSYSALKPADFKATTTKSKNQISQTLNIKLTTKQLKNVKIHLPGKQGVKSALAGAAVAQMLGISAPNIKKVVSKLEPYAGRMKILNGIKKSILIDDTYNSSPLAVKAALDVLYNLAAKQRIAILGNMNELGSYSKEAHFETGNYCDPKKLDLVITIGQDANRYLALSARQKGCRVLETTSPYHAGELAKSELKTGGAILVKGSQNRVFAEEALKILLANKQDESILVRQSPYWLKIKKQQFSDSNEKR